MSYFYYEELQLEINFKYLIYIATIMFCMGNIVIVDIINIAHQISSTKKL